MTLGQLLRDARSAAGFTQADLAERAGTSQAAVARYESDTVSPSVRTLERLMRACGRRLTLGVDPTSSAADVRGARMQELRRRRLELQRLVHAAGARDLRVFGSVARGEDGPDSDVDLLVDFDVAAHGAFPLVRLGRQLAELLGEPVDVVARDLLRPEIRAQVEAESVPV